MDILSNLPPSLLEAICSFSHSPALHALCSVSRTFHTIASPHLYRHLNLCEPTSAYHAFLTLQSNRTLASYVRILWVYVAQRTPGQAIRLPEPWWHALSDALAHTNRLTQILIFDPAFSQPNSASIIPGYPTVTSSASVLNNLNAPTLQDARLQVGSWSPELFLFAQKHSNLDRLFMTVPPSTLTTDLVGNMDVGDPQIQPTLPSLRTLSCSLLSAIHLVPCARELVYLRIDAPEIARQIAHVGEGSTTVQAQIDVQRVWGALNINFSKALARVRCLRSLVITNIPEDNMEAKLWQAVRNCSKTLTHFGLLPLPSGDRQVVREVLSEMPCLRTLEVDVSTWQPQPPESQRRALCAGLQAFAPKLERIVIYVPSGGRNVPRAMPLMYILAEPGSLGVDGLLPWPVWICDHRVDRSLISEMWRES